MADPTGSAVPPLTAVIDSWAILISEMRRRERELELLKVTFLIKKNLQVFRGKFSGETGGLLRSRKMRDFISLPNRTDFPHSD